MAWNWNTYPRKAGSSNKYKNEKVTVGGVEFDSKKEARRFQELLLLQLAGKITDLQRQVKFILIPAQREPDIIGPKGGRKPGKLLERECAYLADFVYIDKATGEKIVEDTKGIRTPEYIIKRKLMLWIYKIRIKEL